MRGGVGTDGTVGRLEEAKASFVGEIWQRPPMYSAVKVKGTRLYQVPHPPRPPRVQSLRQTLNPISVKVKGTRLYQAPPPPSPSSGAIPPSNPKP